MDFAAAASATASTLPSVLANGPALHSLVRVHLTNGAIVTGRLIEMDGNTMNMKLDALTHTAVARTIQEGSSSSLSTSNAAAMTGKSEYYHSASATGTSGTNGGRGSNSASTTRTIIENNPVALRCLGGMVIRGAFIRFIDFISEEKSGGRGLGEITAAAESVRPTL